MKAWTKKVCALLGLSMTLAAAGLGISGPVLAQPAAGGSSAAVVPLGTPPCVTALPPSPNFYRDARYAQPNACRKCQAAGATYEATRDFDAHCQNLLNPAGTVTAVQLWLRCIACRNAVSILDAAGWAGGGTAAGIGR